MAETKRKSQLIQEARTHLDDARHLLYLTEHKLGKMHDRDEDATELSKMIVELYHALEEECKKEIAEDDITLGPSYIFVPRGIGLDRDLRCFVCGVMKRNDKNFIHMNNIAAFVKSKVEGETVFD